MARHYATYGFRDMTTDGNKGITASDLAVALRIITSADESLDTAIESQLTRLAGVAQALCESYAPAAPESIKNEAAIRVASYLYDVSPGAVNAPQNAFVHSGAMALLSFCREQRATLVRESA